MTSWVKNFSDIATRGIPKVSSHLVSGLQASISYLYIYIFFIIFIFIIYIYISIYIYMYVMILYIRWGYPMNRWVKACLLTTY